MASPSYNGWPGAVRDKRGNKRVYLRKKKNLIPPPTICAFCGAVHEKDGYNTYHAEEYGSTWEDYNAACIPLCPYCHGMIHVRFRYPNRFKRMKARVADGSLFRTRRKVKNLNEFFKVIRSVRDIGYQPDCKTGILQLDGIALTKYVGPQKIITIINEAGEEVPDPAYHQPDLFGISGVIVRPFKSITEAHWPNS